MRRGTATIKRNPVDRAHHFLHLLGWSCGDSCFRVSGKPPVWTVYAHRDTQRILTRAETQAAAWDEALRQAAVVQRDG